LRLAIRGGALVKIEHVSQRSLWEAGVTFFKVFTCTTGGAPGVAWSADP
jgi:hypothetical protein